MRAPESGERATAPSAASLRGVSKAYGELEARLEAEATDVVAAALAIEDAADVPITFLMPSAVVADVVARSHSSWLAIPGRDGRPHMDSNTRRLAPTYSHDVPGLAPDWMEPRREDWGLLTDAVGCLRSGWARLCG